jgi:sugar phosphate isomerase/epimerase
LRNKINIRIGNQTSIAALSVMQPFEYAVANGFDTFEWFLYKRSSEGHWTENDISKELRTIIRNTAFAHDISMSVHAPWDANPLKTEDRELLFKSIDFAQEIGASLFNIHLYKDKEIAPYAEAITPLVKLLVKAGIKLSIENTPETGPEDFNELFRHLRNIFPAGNVYVGMCFDLGHANLYPATRNDYIRFFDMIDPDVPIIHIHMHENYGDYDSHLPLFTGPSGKDTSGIKGFIERMKKRNFSGCIILEQWPQPENLLNKAREKLLDMIGNSMDG